MPNGLLLFIALLYVGFKIDAPLRESMGFPPSKQSKQAEKKVEPKVLGYGLNSNSYVRCAKIAPTDCGATIYECINGAEKHECVPESDLKFIREGE
jgi:hypothetical protein